MNFKCANKFIEQTLEWYHILPADRSNICSESYKWLNRLAKQNVEMVYIKDNKELLFLDVMFRNKSFPVWKKNHLGIILVYIYIKSFRETKQDLYRMFAHILLKPKVISLCHHSVEPGQPAHPCSPTRFYTVGWLILIILTMIMDSSKTSALKRQHS